MGFKTMSEAGLRIFGDVFLVGYEVMRSGRVLGAGLV